MTGYGVAQLTLQRLRRAVSALILVSLSLNSYFTGIVQKAPLLLSLALTYDFVLLPKRDIPVVMLRTSSMAATDSSLGVEDSLPSVFAAMLARARVAFLEIVSWFMIGTLPMSRLKMRVDLSASFTASLNLLCSAFSSDSDTCSCDREMSTRMGTSLPVAELCLPRLGGAARGMFNL